MDIRKIIWYLIMFTVGFVYFMIVRFVRLPHLKVFIYALPPHGLFVTIYNFIKGLLLKLFSYVFMFFIVLTLVYYVISLIPPPFKQLFQKIPPLPILKRFGIFDFIWGLLKAIFTVWPLKEKPLAFGKVFGAYIAKNTTEFMQLLGVQNKLMMIKGRIQAQTDALKSSITNKPDPSRQEKLQRNANLPESPMFEASVYRKIDDEYKQCIEENLVSAPADASKMEIRGIDSRNAVTRIMCKSKYLNAHLLQVKAQIESSVNKIKKSFK